MTMVCKKRKATKWIELGVVIMLVGLVGRILFNRTHVSSSASTFPMRHEEQSQTTIKLFSMESNHPNAQQQTQDVARLPHAIVKATTRDYFLPHSVSPSQNRLAKPYNKTSTTFYRDEDLPYISTLRERSLSLHAQPNQTTLGRGHQKSPRTATKLFDIFSQRKCLPSKECIGCFRNTDFVASCETCRKQCGCYCKFLCKISLPPPPVTKEIIVRPPRYSRDPTRRRLIPRMVHQTWFEEINVQKYPNTGRLVESFRQSGWEYRFYTDDMMATFLTTHFPPEVRQAYDDLIPGAFKADLFRCCVLLIHGGLYADVDILLESNLDAVIGPDVGFLAPFDSMPGWETNNRMCIWNGFMAAAPGHPFLAKTIEMVVNNILNRYTTVDYDHIFCPTPQLSILHRYDVLYTSGPCILGAVVNQLLGRPSQMQFEEGDVSHENATVPIPGRTIILLDSKYDLGAHHFTLWEKSMIVAGTDFPYSNDRIYPNGQTHYSAVRHNGAIYGLDGLYHNNHNQSKQQQQLRFHVTTRTTDE